MPDGKRYYDADGHVIERDGDVHQFLDQPFRGVRTRALPSLDRFHTPNSSSVRRREGTFEPADAKRWLEFLETTGIEWTVLYSTDGLAYGRVIYPEWAVAYARAYNDWLYERFMQVSPRLKGAALSPVRECHTPAEAGGGLYNQKVVGTGPFAFVERKVGSYVLYTRVDHHWRKTPEYQELEFRWVPEGVTRLATLLAEEVHISDVDRALQKDALAKGMQILTSQLPAIQHYWHFGGLYFLTPEKLDPKVPFVDKRVRQAMNMAINRQAIAENLLGGKVQPHRINGYHPQLDSALWPGIWNPDWDRRADELYGYDPTKAKQLLEQAGYPNGFEFTIYLYTLPGLPEIVEIGQAMALDFQAVGLKPKLMELDFPRVREMYRTKTIHGALFALRHGLRALDLNRLSYKSKESIVYGYEHASIDERLEALGRVVDPGERARLLREIGDLRFNEFSEIPLFWLFAEAAINPKFIAEYVFPGVITGYYTHLEYIKLAR